jgi:hypothetical protein
MTPIASVVAANWRPRQSGTLLGFVDLAIADVGMTIRDVTVHAKNGSRWLCMPGRAIFDKATGLVLHDERGKVRYQPTIEIAPDARRAFQVAALAAVDRLTGAVVPT